MNMAEKVFEEVRTLPELEIQEVLDFVGFLKARHDISVSTAFNDAYTDWGKLQHHARDLITDPVKTPDLALMDEVRSKVRTGATWTRDELHDRGLR